MKKSFFKIKYLLPCVTCVLLSLSFNSFAQDQRQQMTPEQRAERQTTMMQKNMNLTTDQTAKVKDINAKYASKNADLMQAGGDQSQARQKMMMDKEAEMKGVLTADQFAQYQKMEQAMMQRMKGRMQPATSAPAQTN
jgi:periplasmic protein CpxP/Spy